MSQAAQVPGKGGQGPAATLRTGGGGDDERLVSYDSQPHKMSNHGSDIA